VTNNGLSGLLARAACIVGEDEALRLVLLRLARRRPEDGRARGALNELLGRVAGRPDGGGAPGAPERPLG